MASNEVFQEAPGGVVALTPGTNVPARSFLIVNCTVAGNVVAIFNDDSEFTYAVQVGSSEIWGKIKGVKVSGTTATATYAVK